MADSVFKDVEMGPPIEVFHVGKLYTECQHPEKVNLGVGAYRTEEGKPWVLPVVMAAEMQMANDKTLNHEYLPVSGLPDFREAAVKVLLGSNHKVISENRVEAFQSLGGTGALRLGAAFLKDVLHYDTVYVSAPTWGNHKGVFKRAGFSNVKEYRYWDEDTRSIDFKGMLDDLSAAPVKSVVILHGVAHNPTGMDPSRDQWEEIYQLCKEKNLFVLMDIAYQGFASGNLDEDAWAVRLFADRDVDMFVAQSFSKNFGLYNERVGCLTVISKDGKKLPDIRSQMELTIRTMYSNPSNHGARIVATVLNNKAYFEDWKGQITTMASRIKKVRQELVENLKKLGTPGNWDHITKQIGMFSYTGLNGKQVEYLKNKYVFLLSSGRISLCGLNSKNIGYVAKSIDEAVRTHPTLHMAQDAGTPGIGVNVESFETLAKRKLRDTMKAISTGVTIDGMLVGEEDENDDVAPSESDVVDFVKVKLKGSLTALSTPEMRTSVAAEAMEYQPGLKGLEVSIEHRSQNTSYTDLNEDLSVATQYGTLRSTMKTFSSRGAQTKKDDYSVPKSIPARFQGTMVTPVFFEGMMMTPEKLEQLMQEAMSKNENVSIPVQFKGGMVTAAFRSLLESSQGSKGIVSDEAGRRVKVKFEGRLQGVMDSGICKNGIPVVFDGSMANK